MIQRKEIITKHGTLSYLDTNVGTKTIIYIHGAFGGPDAMEVVDKHLQKDGWRTIAPCLPGHGRSFKISKNYSYNDMVDTFNEFVGCFTNVDAIFGHSFGGRLAYDLDIDRKRVLFAPILRNSNQTFVKVAASVIKDFSRVKKGDSVLGESDLKINLTRFSDMKRIWRIINSMPDANSHSFRSKELFMWAENDLVVPIKVNQAFVQETSNRILNIYNGGHYWFLNEGKHWEDVRWFINST